MVTKEWEWKPAVCGHLYVLSAIHLPWVHSGLAPHQGILGKGSSVRALFLKEDIGGGLVMALRPSTQKIGRMRLGRSVPWQEGQGSEWWALWTLRLHIPAPILCQV